MAHIGGVNRLRCMPQTAGIVATMADTGKVNIFDLSGCMHNFTTRTVGSAALNTPTYAPPTGPVFTFNGHNRDGAVVEGFGLDWSRVVPGRLATGDMAGNVFVWNVEAGSEQSRHVAGASSALSVKCSIGGTGMMGVGGGKYEIPTGRGGASSVEDIQWSPSETTVFCTASTDRSVRIWDIRGKGGPQISLANAHDDDVNVISWNSRVSYLLASGCDDGSFKVTIVMSL